MLLLLHGKMPRGGGGPVANLSCRLMVSELNVCEPDDAGFLDGRHSGVLWSTGYVLSGSFAHIALNTPREKAIDPHG